MIATAGLLAILIATGAAIVLAVRGLTAAHSGVVEPGRLLQPAIVLAAAGIGAFVLLELGIVAHDYSIKYVANTTSNATPFVFLLASGWAALQPPRERPHRRCRGLFPCGGPLFGHRTR